MKTADRIQCFEKNGFGEGYCDKAQCQLAIAIAQFKKGDRDGANRTIESIQLYPQYQDDAHYEFVRLQVEKGDFRTAIVTADRIRQLSKRAVALLSISKAAAIAGDREQATEIAAHIDLPCEEFLIKMRREGFQFQSPRTWGLKFDFSFGMPSLHSAYARSAEVASAAMSLALTLDRPPNESLAVLFDKFVPQVVFALAREQARSGNANEALIWAKQIGDETIVKAKGNYLSDSLGVQRRIDAMIGVAEGILDRSNVAPTPPY